MTDYRKMTTEDYDRLLIEEMDTQIQEHGTQWLLSVPGIAEILIEELHNAVLDRWEQSQPPGEEDEDTTP